jgi:hypothetical protein
MLGLYHEIQATDDQDGTAQPAHLSTFVGIEDEPDWHPR